MKNKLNLRAPVATVVAIFFGWAILLTYIIPLDGMVSLRDTVLSLVVILSAAALLVGVINLLSVHVGKIQGGKGSSLYSFSLVIALILTFTITYIQGPNEEWPQWLLTYIQIPVEASLMAVMAVTLTYASSRLLIRRTNVFSVIFVISLLLALVAINPILGLKIGFVRLFANAGARGILLGVGLGTVATGLRILIGSDRPYGG